MKWYVAKLVFQILNNSKIQQFDEQLRLISALDYNEAFINANEIARTDENEFIDLYNNKVVWKFKAITYLSEVDILKNGTELCSQIIEKKPEENFLNSIKLKQEEIISKVTNTIE